MACLAAVVPGIMDLAGVKSAMPDLIAVPVPGVANFIIGGALTFRMITSVRHV
jgi:hypothetical protein